MSAGVATLLVALAARGVRMRAEGDRLKLRDPGRTLDEADLSRLREHKPEILAFLAARPRCCECGYALVEEPSSWWGLHPVHRDCGQRAWQHHWQAPQTVH